MLLHAASPSRCSSGLECGWLLVVEVGHARLELIPLLFLGGASASSHLSQLALVLAIGQNLLATQVLLLERPHALLVLLLLASHLGFLDLKLALVEDGLLLLLVHSLEVVGLDTVWRQH